MARMQHTPRYPLGTRVLKRFPGYAVPFKGTVDQISSASGFYHITYDDGDSEEMTEEDVTSHFHSASRGRKTPIKKDTESKPTATTATKTRKLSSSGSPRQKQTTAIMTKTAGKEEGDEDMADGEEEGDDETETSGANRLIGQKVCKKLVQADGKASLVLSGTVLTYFPATGLYRVVYGNGTTDDMSYREIVDSIPLSSPRINAKGKRKSEEDESNDKGTVPSASSKKRKVYENDKKKATATTTDENTNSENGLPQDNGSAFDPPSPGEENEAVWNKARAFETVRAVLFVVTSTSSSSVAQKPLKVLEQKDLKAKKALEMFVDAGGLMALEERLRIWGKEKEKESGVLAILKVLAVMPGVTTNAVQGSKIGVTLNNIRKGKTGDEMAKYGQIVREMAGYVVKKWRAELVDNKKPDRDTAEKKSGSKETIVSRPVKSTSHNSKSTNGDSKGNDNSSSNGNGNSNSESTTKKSGLVGAHKRSNSETHLRVLMGGRRSGDYLGSALGARSTSRPLGAAHARRARRSTVLLDSLAESMTKNSAAEKMAASRGENGSRERGDGDSNADGWAPSRVRFGEISTLEFLKDLEVALLLVKGGPGGFRSKQNAGSMTTVPSTGKKPIKSALRVKLSVNEREAIAAANKASERNGEADEQKEGEDVPVIIASGKNAVATEEKEEQIGGRSDNIVRNEVPITKAVGKARASPAPPSPPRTRDKSPAPPSPPRTRDKSHDDYEDEDGDMPDDLVIGDMPSPPSELIQSETTSESLPIEDSGIKPVERNYGKDMMNGRQQEEYRQEGAASPIVSSDAPSSPESGEIEDSDLMNLSPPPVVAPPPPTPPRSPQSPPLPSLDAIIAVPDESDPHNIQEMEASAS